MPATYESIRDLEDIVDSIGLQTALELLADICHEKAIHLETNWQDKVAARMWDKAGNRVLNCAHSNAVSEVSPA